MKKQFKNYLPYSFIPFLLFLVNCGGPQKSFQETIGYEYAPDENSLLWEISGNGLKESSFLYGTIHIQRKEVFAYDTIVQKIFDTCAAYAMEVNMEEVNPIKASKMMMMEKPLDELISREKYVTFDSIFRAQKGMGIGMMKTTKPFFLMAMLMEKEIGTDMKLPLDLHFFSMAKNQGMKVIGIEKFEDQMAAIDMLSIDEQVDMVIGSVGDTTSAKAKFDEMLAQYIKGDLTEMIRLSEDTTYPEKFKNAFIYDRNIHMADRIAEICAQQRTFNAIGAAHLGGPKGVIALLRAKGFTVKPVKTVFKKP